MKVSATIRKLALPTKTSATSITNKSRGYSHAATHTKDPRFVYVDDGGHGFALKRVHLVISQSAAISTIEKATVLPPSSITILR